MFGIAKKPFMNMFWKAVKNPIFDYVSSFQDSNSHDSMAVLIANEILSGSKDVVKVLCKSLPKLEISAGNDILVKDLSILCDRILKVILLLYLVLYRLAIALESHVCVSMDVCA